MVGGVRPGQPVIGGGDVDLPGHLSGDLLHQGSRRSQWTARRRRLHRTTRAVDHRARRGRTVGPAGVSVAVGAAGGDVAGGRGPHDHLCSAATPRAALGGRRRSDGPERRAGPGSAAEGRAVIVPAGLKLPGVSGLPLGSRMSDWGYAAGWRMVRAMPEFAARNVFDAAALYASRNGGPAQLRKNLARVIGVAPKEVPASLMRASLASYARYWRGAVPLPAMDPHAGGQQLA